MKGKNRLKNISQKVINLVKNGQVEVLLGSGETTTVRFANSQVHQPISQLADWVKVRVAVGKKIGVASGNQLDDKSLKNLVNRAVEICHYQKDDPAFAGLPRPRKLRFFKHFDEKTAKASSRILVNKVKPIINQAVDKKLIASGNLTRSAGEMAIANSKGVWAYQKSTEVSLTSIILNSLAGSDSGYASDLGWRLDQIQEEDVACQAVEKALASRLPQSLEPGEYEVILEPAAFQEVLDFFTWLGPNARVYHEDVSYFKGRLGKKVFSPLLTVVDDPFDRRGLPTAFDYEGQPKQKLTIVRNGFIRNIAYDSYYARKYGQKNTSHALPAPNTFGPLVSHLVIKPGQSSLKQMIGNVKRGLLVTRLWYIRSVHFGEMLLTGTTRDGLFLIENGQVVAPVRDLRFTESIPRMFKNILEVGSELEPHPSWGGGAHLCPPVRIANFRFTGNQVLKEG